MPDLTPEAQHAMDCLDALGYALRKALPLKGPHEPAEPEPAKTPTKVAWWLVDRYEHVYGRSDGAVIFQAELSQRQAVVRVEFVCWPEAWRGELAICEAGRWVLRSHGAPEIIAPDLWSPGSHRHQDGMVAQHPFDNTDLAAEAYDGILALLNAAKALAEATLTLEDA